MAGAVFTVMMLGGATGVSAQADTGGSAVKLTSSQETCMAGAKSAAKGMSKADRKATIKSAALECGVWRRFDKLSDTQKSCLASNGLKRPSGAPSKAHKKALRALASKCGVALKIKG